ncbi:DoxX family protein [Staphylococcus xylosus]|uniref:DoxX family protein n=1 Tax=Staphylococcus xylosus TaxID=1288 RepID=UPI003F54E7C2
MNILIIIFQILLAAFFLMTGSKIATGKMAEEFKRFGFPSLFNLLTGTLEIIGALSMLLGIWTPVIALFSGLLLSTTMLVAAFTLIVIAKDPFKKAMPAIILCVISVFVALYNYSII